MGTVVAFDASYHTNYTLMSYLLVVHYLLRIVPLSLGTSVACFALANIVITIKMFNLMLILSRETSRLVL